DTDTGGQVYRRRGQRVRLGQHGQHPARQRVRVHRAARGGDRELVAGQARRQVVDVDRVAQPARGLHEYGVPGVVTAYVVDRGEPVEVDHEYRAGLAGPLAQYRQ